MDNFEGEIQVSDISDSYFSDKSETKTIDFIAINEFSDWTFKFWLWWCTFAEKNMRKAVASHKVCMHHQFGIHWNKIKPFNFQCCLLNISGCVISENIKSNSTVFYCFFDAKIQYDLVR